MQQEEEVGAVMGKKAEMQEADSGLRNNTVVNISENTLASIRLGDIVPGQQVAGLLEVCKAAPRLVTAGNMSANTEDNKTSGSWLDRVVEGEGEVALAKLVEGLAACSKKGYSQENRNSGSTRHKNLQVQLGAVEAAGQLRLGEVHSI